MIFKSSRIHTFYHPDMSVNPENLEGFVNSPAKPRLMIEYIERKGLSKHFLLDDNFLPFSKDDFYVAHTRVMVDNFFDHGKTSRILNLKWSPEYARSVKYTNSSLYHSIRYAVEHPEEVCFSPTSGFHHAHPKRCALACAFSGQVIASVKIYREYGLCGSYIDLDGHHGNSIDNARDFVEDLDLAISTVCGNINIYSDHRKYIEELKGYLQILRKEILENRIHYVVFCHGADSHEWDELSSQLTTEEWIECSVLVYSFINDLQNELRRQIPVILSLFGGYRKDDYDSVLSLHTADLVSCLNILCGGNIEYKPEVKPRV
jgi:acetoin utilization deacetylase AcuC-like enzyme